MVWKQVKALRSKGYQIESSPNKGYCLAKDQDIIDPDLIHKGLETEFVGRDLRYFREVESTNKIAREIAAASGNGTVVLAEVQTQGKGRLSRPWLSPPGGVWTSIILKPEIPLAKAYQINMAISIAIVRTLIGLYGIKPGIKWPNDILINERKLCGILIEVNAEMDRLEYAVVGIGINANVNEENFPPDWHATSISREVGRQVSRTKLIQVLLREIEKAYAELGSPEIYSEWQARSSTLGRHVRVISTDGEIEGYAISFSEDGALELELAEEPREIRRIVAGDCVHLRTVVDLRGTECGADQEGIDLE